MTTRWLTSRRRLDCRLTLVLITLGVGGLLIAPCDSKISDLRQCYDEKCSDVVSLGKTTIPYHSKDPDILSFPANVDVKIYSKQAGKRKDLWGVEIRNKRGYAPLKFIRESKVLKNFLKFTVPTEAASQEEKNVNTISETIISPVQDQVPTSVDTFNKSEETINPQEISPSYESVYDGTIIPQDIEEASPPQPSYSTRTLQNSVKSEEDVQLNVYPNIISSTFSAISGILGGSEDTSEKDNIEVASSDESIIDRITEKTLEITKPKELSPISEEIQSLYEPVTLLESKVESVIEDPVIEPKVNENVIIDIIPQVSTSAEESIVSKEDSTTESRLPSEDKEIVSKLINVVENDIELISPIEPASSESSAKVLSSSESIIPVLSLEINVKEETKPVVEKSVIVPKVKEAVSVIVDPINNDTDAVASPNLILDKLEVLNDTEGFVKIKDSTATITAVPLKQEIKEEILSIPSQPFLPTLESSLQLNFSESVSPPIESTEYIEVSQPVTETSASVEESKPTIEETLQIDKPLKVDIVDSNNVTNTSYTTDYVPTYVQNDSVAESVYPGFQPANLSEEYIVDIPSTSSFNKFLDDQNSLNAVKDSEEIGIDESAQPTVSNVSEENTSAEAEKVNETTSYNIEEVETLPSDVEKVVLPPKTCDREIGYETKHQYTSEENTITTNRMIVESSDTLIYACIMAVTTLLFSLGYYLIENQRRDAYLISKINKLEKDLMITRKECIMLDENFKSTKTKLDSIEDESFGSNEMVLSLKAELEVSEKEKEDLKDQIASLERDLEGASEAGLELECMLREILATQSEDNPLAQSIQDLQDHLTDQQNANVALTKALALKTQENETLMGDLDVNLKKVDRLQLEISKLADGLTSETNLRMSLEVSLSDQVQQLETQVKTLNDDKSYLRKQLKMKELEIKELLSVVEQNNLNNIDFEKLYEVTHIKAEAAHLQEERDELQMKLNEEEGAHQLLEEHVKLVKEEVAHLSEQCKAAEKEKKDAETRLEVLTKFFEEKEAQRQKEEALWLEKQGEHSSTVERIQTMQNELLSYKQQIEMLKREILDQEREYKNQIASLEIKAHEHWVAARQNERRLEEMKADSSQLRNRLTLVEKNINDIDPEAKLHRLQQQTAANGDASGHLLFPGSIGENSTSPLMFSSGTLPPPSYLYGGVPGAFPPPLPPFLPPPLPSGSSVTEAGVGSRPAPLGGGRLSSPPPPGRPGSPPSLSPPPMLHHSFRHPHPHHPLHSPPPLPPYASDVPLPPSMLHHPPHMMPPPPPPHLRHPQSQLQQQDGIGNWSSDSLPGSRNMPPPLYVQQRSRNHKGSLHSSGESLDKSYGGKV